MFFKNIGVNIMLIQSVDSCGSLTLHIRGEPMVNDRTDADRFEREYGVKVCS